jgi:hypothetical protein
MNAETVFSAPPPTEGSTPPPPHDTIAYDTPVSPDSEAHDRPECERPEGGSKSNAYKH